MTQEQMADQDIFEQSLDSVIQDIRNETKKLNEKLLENNAAFDSFLNKLKEEIYVLKKIPEAMSFQLTEIIPAISTELHKVIFQDLDRNLCLSSAKLDELAEKANATSIQIDKILASVAVFQSSQIKRKIMSSTLMALTFLSLLSGASYLMYKKFPSSVWVNTRGDVHIDGGEVLIRKMPQSSPSRPTVSEKR